MPIRGHSGVQGGAEVGCVPSLNEAHQKRLEEDWGFAFPDFAGLGAAEQVDAAIRGEIDVFWIVGGNFLETLPDPAAVEHIAGTVDMMYIIDIYHDQRTLHHGNGDREIVHAWP